MDAQEKEFLIFKSNYGGYLLVLETRGNIYTCCGAPRLIRFFAVRESIMEYFTLASKVSDLKAEGNKQ